jgi:hypothetical protein
MDGSMAEKIPFCKQGPPIIISMVRQFGGGGQQARNRQAGRKVRNALTHFSLLSAVD